MTEQRVAKRKTHTKSRKGCFQCKQRHTKVRVHIRSFRCVLQPITVYYPICCLYPSKWSLSLDTERDKYGTAAKLSCYDLRLYTYYNS